MEKNHCHFFGSIIWMEILKLPTNMLLELIHMIFIEMNHILYSLRKYNLKEFSIYNNRKMAHRHKSH